MAPKTRKKPGTGKSQPRSRLEDARERMYHDLVFESAEHVFGAHGFEQTTMQQLAHEAGISLKTLYSAFSGKQELYNEIQRVRGQAFVESAVEATRAGDGGLDRLERLVEAYVAFLFEHEDWLRIHLRERLAWGLAPFEGYANEYWQRGLDNMADTIRRGMDEGVFYEGDPQVMGMMALAIMQVQVANASGDPEAVAAEISTQLHRLLRRPAASAERPSR